jgi:threonine synthase
MTTEVRPISNSTSSTAVLERPRDDTESFLDGLRCRHCGRAEAIGPSFVCPACFGPLEVVYDLPRIARSIDHATIARRPANVWRYRELLPVDTAPSRGLQVGSTPLIRGDRLGAEIGIDTLWLKDDTRNPTLSFKDRPVAMAAARAVEFGFDTLACASTGNLAGATAAAAAALGLRAFVFIPSDLEAAKIEHALAFGATVIPVDGTYDDVNRLSLEIADEEGWAFVNVNLRPYYSEGSKTLSFEIAEQLGWRLPDAVVAPIASGSLFTKVAKGFRELVEVGLVEPKPIRFVGVQALGCGPVATAWASGSDTVVPVRHPHTIVKSLSIGSPADGGYSLALARSSGGAIEGVSDPATADAIRLLGRTEGVAAETAGGVTVAGAAKARAANVIRRDEETVILITGNGVKTPDARRYGLDGEAATSGSIGLAAPIAPTLSAFEQWLQGS